MALFRRKRRDVGTFEPPAPRPAPDPEHLVDEGLMIAESAIRMSVKNHLIVQALRHRADFDPAELAGVAAERMLELADQEDGYAGALHERGLTTPIDAFDAWGDDEPSDTLRAERREALHRGLAAKLRAFATDDDALAALIDAARTAAWDEIQGSIVARAERNDAVIDERYATERADRLASLIAIDLTGLAVERGVDPADL
jgi:hypothetical protein